ncbi:hypothetical protein MLD38_014062 [Melastoma candidum]|uniref:Uncharacterized protein n=1 Tax=Melastoma candidum TaxID=119954 RepID=A0ACB9REN9_9MYRT|nr:hypothetical protein MLD38_014062 [Melastoma candidum]
MDFMKVLDQTVREIKREVNLKVLKVPEIEQKVLDATDNEPWGPHGTALAEIAQATKNFTECQLIMNVLWTRIGETGKDWRYVYKALAVIEYLVAHGSERALDDIIEHTFKISSLTSFEYVEQPSGKDFGINVRKKAETIVSLLNNKDKIQEVRNKASSNRDKYFGLSSSGASYKSAGGAFGSSNYDSNSSYGGFKGSKERDRFSDSYKDGDEDDKDSYRKPRDGVKNDSGSKSTYGSTGFGSKSKDNKASTTSKTKLGGANEGSSVPSSAFEEDIDDFDPRGTSAAKSATANSNQVADPFGGSLIGDLLDAPISVPSEQFSANNHSGDVDLFADATFVSAPSTVQSTSSQKQNEGDHFASKQPVPPAASSAFDFFSAPDPVIQPQTQDVKPAPVSQRPSEIPTVDSMTSSMKNETLKSSVPQQKKDGFQVKSGIWADSLSRGLIDLNISAPKKVSLADVGIVGGLSDTSDDRDKGPSANFYMGRAMGTSSSLGRSGLKPSQLTGEDDFFSSFISHPSQYNSFKN